MNVLFVFPFRSSSSIDGRIHNRNEIDWIFSQNKIHIILPEAFQCENIKELLTSPLFCPVMLPNSILNRYRFNFMNAPCFIWAKFLFQWEHVKRDFPSSIFRSYQYKMTSLNGIYYKLKALLNTSLYNTVCKSEQRQACVRIYKEQKHVRRFFTKFPVNQW